MPSRVRAGLQGPQGQIAEASASPAQHDKENMAPPVLQEVEIVYNTEYALDLRARKRFDWDANDQQYYVGHAEDPSPSYPDFPMPGLASADKLRGFLHQTLQPDQILDEYGNECEITDVSNDHLPVLQAKLWVKISGGRSPVKATIQRPSRAQNLIAGHVAKILQLLEGKQGLYSPTLSWLMRCRKSRFHKPRGPPGPRLRLYERPPDLRDTHLPVTESEARASRELGHNRTRGSIRSHSSFSP